ncbi:thiamine pyrophosphate-dependent enzyme [Streptomyces prunicolor]|uniref:thiamine pyrophosphate-dependent enzyme n=1 Tax=Streptomyces prunicolor TaxID=67348 RepID=UPI0033DE1ECD
MALQNDGGRALTSRGPAELVPATSRPAPAPRVPLEIPPVVDALPQPGVRRGPHDGILVGESLRGGMAMRNRVKYRRPGCFFCGAGGLGSGLPAAVGTKLAQPGRPVLVVTGDGERSTASRPCARQPPGGCRSPFRSWPSVSTASSRASAPI